MNLNVVITDSAKKYLNTRNIKEVTIGVKITSGG